jgi:hypothetical protein
MEDQNFILPASIRTALISYLSSRPYAEVQEGVAALLALQPVESEE